VNLATLVDRHHGGAAALHDGDRWHTWEEVRQRATTVASGLAQLGVRPDDRVGIAWPTSVDFVVAYLGVLAVGAVAVPLNPNSPPNELRREIEAVEPVVLLAGRAAGESETAAARPGAAAAAKASSVRHVAVPADVVTDTAAVVDETANVVTWEELSSPDCIPTRSGGRLAPLDRADSDLAVLLFTSGTAGDPKPAMLTHGNLTANLRQMLAVPEIIGADDVGLVAVPLFHVFGLNVALGLALATGARLALEARFDPARSLEAVRDLAVTTVMGVPSMFAAWADLPDGADGDSPMTRVRRAISGAAALDVGTAERFETRFGVPLWQGYGLTEASPAVSTSLGTGRHRLGSVGRPLPGVEVQLVDEAGEPVLAGDPGEIWVRGANVFVGYWRDPDTTAKVLSPEGWLRTGDVGVVGEDGDLFVVDRSKDLVIVSGFNVFPAEVERVVADMDGVDEAVVIGRPDPTTGEAVEVVVVPAPGAAVTVEDVRARCAANLARYKCPTSIRFVPALPHGLTGKALRRALRDVGSA
jgi:long-chain acyl-CoA synthetase